MQTIVQKINEQSLREAARLIAAGQVVAFPTETVYGLGANALDSEAVHRIYQAKGRPNDNPMIVHVADRETAQQLSIFTPAAQTLADAYWPGPLTMVLYKTPMVPDVVTAGLDSVGLRMPNHEDALRFLRACALPVAAPSANWSGRPSPTTAQHVLEDMDGRIPMVLDGGSTPIGVESTVLDLTGAIPVVLRPGAITPEQIALLLGACDVAESILRPMRDEEPALSPGMRHRHYAPRARLTLVDGSPKSVAMAICAAADAHPGAQILAMEQHMPLYHGRPVHSLGSDAREAAHRLYYLLREMDNEGVNRIFCETLPADGLGLAVMNRLARAAEFDILRVG